MQINTGLGEEIRNHDKFLSFTVKKMYGFFERPGIRNQTGFDGIPICLFVKQGKRRNRLLTGRNAISR